MDALPPPSALCFLSTLTVARDKTTPDCPWDRTEPLRHSRAVGTGARAAHIHLAGSGGELLTYSATEAYWLPRRALEALPFASPARLEDRKWGGAQTNAP